MRETCEFRVNEEFADRLFRPDEGKVLGGWIRQVEISTSDPRFLDVGRLQAELTRTVGKPFFYGWNIRRRYSRQELADATLLKLWFTSTFEPAGEECHTQYDDEVACAFCGSGGRQVSDLHVALGRIPKEKDVSRTIADEIVVSARMSEVLLRNGVGADALGAVRNSSGSTVSGDWQQLIVPQPTLNVVPPTRAGGSLFDDPDSIEHKCPVGHLMGLNLLSELHVDRRTYDGAPLVALTQFVGVRRGLLRPRRILCVSQELWRAIERERIKGIQVEVVYLV
jgi:hypothetical protein